MTRKVIFWSSVDAAMFMRATVDSICATGVHAEHRFAVSGTAYRKASTPWERIVLRLRMYIEYPIRLAWACAIDREPRICVVTTNTFFAPWVALLFSRRHQLVIHLVWDLFPDALIEGNDRTNYDWVASRIAAVVQQIFIRVAANVFLGQRLLEHAKSKFREVPRAHIIPVGADARVFANFPPHLVGLDMPVDILYCGNLGSMHDAKTVIDALRASAGRVEPQLGFSLAFHASGPLYAAFKKQMQEIDGVVAKNTLLAGTLNDVEWTQRMKQAHVALVTMKPGSEKVVMPSKTYSALAAGQAILAICPSDSDLARLLREENCGWVVTPGCHAELWDALKEIATNRNLLQTKRENAYRAGQSKFSDIAVAREWVKLINGLSK
jgi:glycosyltransferase involved in cell wall biosynthesis